MYGLGGQRLALLGRNLMAAEGQSTGRALFDAALDGGAAALGVAAGLGVKAGLRVGASADIIALDASHPSLAGRSGDGWLDGWVFATDRAIDTVWRRGKAVVRQGRHVAHAAIVAAYGARIRRLMAL